MREKRLCLAAAQLWARRRNLLPLTCEHPDERIRHAPAVDLLGLDAAGRAVLVLEHTMVESFPGQRAKQLAAFEMFRPLEMDLAHKLPLPGRYELGIAPGSVLGLKRRIAGIRAWVAEWAIATAPKLVIHRAGQSLEHLQTVTVPGTELNVTLVRWPGRKGGLRLVFDAPEDGERQRGVALAKALGDKCTKLSAAKIDSGAETSLLLLEIADIALGNLFDLDSLVVQHETSDSMPLPDSIWIVDTTDQPASLMLSRENARRPPTHADQFLPFELEWPEEHVTARGNS